MSALQDFDNYKIKRLADDFGQYLVAAQAYRETGARDLAAASQTSALSVFRRIADELNFEIEEVA